MKTGELLCDILIAVLLKIQVFLDVMSCRMVNLPIFGRLFNY